MFEEPKAEGPATERLGKAVEGLERANEDFGRAHDRVMARIRVLARIPAARALGADLEALSRAIGAVHEAMTEFVEALKDVAREGQHGG